MKLLLRLLMLCLLFPTYNYAQEETEEEDKKLSVTGSVDAYFRTNLTGPNEAFGDDDIPDFHRLCGDAPGICLLIKESLDLVPQSIPFREQYGQIVLTDRIAKCRLCG